MILNIAELFRKSLWLAVVVLTLSFSTAFSSCNSSDTASNDKITEIVERGTLLVGTTGDKPNTSELAYFLGQVYNYKYDIKRGNVGEIFPEDSLNEIFGVKRLYSSLTQVYSAKRKQRWRSLIDDIFN